MDAEGLLASAAINLGMALVALSLFSLLKKQPGNAPVYLARRMAAAAGDRGGCGILPLGHGRLTPSFRWIRAASRLSDDDLLRRHGLDALAVVRLFKFGIKCFTVCSIVGLFILAPTNYCCEGLQDTPRSNSMELFTVSNVPRGSNRLWVHFACLCFISFYVVYLLHKEYKEMSSRRIAHLKYHRKRPDQFTILVRGIPLCPDHGAYGCCADHFFSKHYRTYQSYHMVHDIGNIEALQKLASSLEEKIKRKRDNRRCGFLKWMWFKLTLEAVDSHKLEEKLKDVHQSIRLLQPGLNSVITGYLPSMILNGFIYLIPFAMLGMASFEGCIAKSRKEIKACNMVFYFLLGNVFFLSILSGSLLHQIGESFTHPKDIPSRLARAVSAQSDFFITYILTDGMSGFSLEVLQFGLLTWHFFRTHSIGHSEQPYLYGFPYYRVVPTVSLAVLIGMVYAVVAPLLLPILVIYFLLGYAVYINQMEDVYEITYDTCGQYWPNIHHHIFLSVTLMQTTMLGLFGLKSKPGASFATVPLLVLTILFNEYCKVRFRPTFLHRPVQVAKENDDLNEAEGMRVGDLHHAISAYKPPWMRPTNFPPDSSSVQPLIRSV
uniref:CSC1/OSCA1-like 7TM region domain-containing protein n=1 Tax=Leersia perrieri TaxID=77586 RepID=A0A0D9VA93_9ORYZ